MSNRSVFLRQSSIDALAAHLCPSLIYSASAGNTNIPRINNFTMRHMKDADRYIYMEAGTGSVNFKTIFQPAKCTGMEYLFVEQDLMKTDPYDYSTQSISYVKSILSK